jgi:outer membrane immunogenic protein
MALGGKTVRNTTRLSIAALAAIALPLAAQAADQRVRVVRRAAAPVVAPFNWTGVYIGASGGQLRGGSDDWVSATPLFCNNPPLVNFVPFAGAAQVAAQALNTLPIGAELRFPNNVPGFENPTAVSGCYPLPARQGVDGNPITRFTVVTPGGLAPVLIASQGSIPTTAINNSLRAPLYGFQAGYNHQFLQRFVGGFEADFHFARGASDLNSLTGTQSIPVVATPNGPSFQGNSITSNFAASETMRYFGTLRARLGWLPWHPVLIYATGGLAYARITSTAVVTQTINGPCGGNGFPPFNFVFVYTCAVSPAFGESTHWRAGITYGGGIEVALGARWSIKGEYLYYKLGGNRTYDLTPLTATTNGATPFFTTGVTATTGNFNGSRWVVGINYNFGAPASTIERP